jgi:hypothetical protein
MTNTTILRGSCPPPFFDMAQFGYEGCMYSRSGQLSTHTDSIDIDGRFCAPIPLKPGLHCCLPCPASDYLYPEKFKGWYRAAEALNLVGLACMAFLVITFICLPAEKTRRHYLSYGLIAGAMSLALGFVVPFASRPEQCFEITPNDMFTDMTCAFSGAFLIAGGMTIAVWSKYHGKFGLASYTNSLQVFIRALSMHLQIVWDYMPAKTFFYSAQIMGWSVAAAFFTTTITVTGVSFRFGEICHVNSKDSMKDFWGPLLAISGGATLIQLAT